MYLVAFFILFSLNNQQNRHHHHHHYFQSSVKGTRRKRKKRRRRRRRRRRAGERRGQRGRISMAALACSVQATPSEVVGDDDVGHGVEHHLDVSCICGAGHVTVDLLVGGAVLALELCLDVSCCVVVGVGSWTETKDTHRGLTTQLVNTHSFVWSYSYNMKRLTCPHVQKTHHVPQTVRCCSSSFSLCLKHLVSAPVSLRPFSSLLWLASKLICMWYDGGEVLDFWWGVSGASSVSCRLLSCLIFYIHKKNLYNTQEERKTESMSSCPTDVRV